MKSDGCRHRAQKTTDSAMFCPSHFVFRRGLCVLLATTLLAGTAVDAQVGPPNRADPSPPSNVSPGNPPAEPIPKPAGSTSTPAAKSAEDEVTINTSKNPLPTLPTDDFTDCMGRTPTSQSGYDPIQGGICQARLEQQKRVVMAACVNSNGDAAPPRVIQACTELLDRNMFEGRDRYPLFANRARARFAQGDGTQALDDYNEAIKLATNRSPISTTPADSSTLHSRVTTRRCRISTRPSEAIPGRPPLCASAPRSTNIRTISAAHSTTMRKPSVSILKIRFCGANGGTCPCVRRITQGP
jgi:hypothetical protein